MEHYENLNTNNRMSLCLKSINQRKKTEKIKQQELIRERVKKILREIKNVRIDIFKLNMEKSFDKLEQKGYGRDFSKKPKMT